MQGLHTQLLHKHQDNVTNSTNTIKYMKVPVCTRMHIHNADTISTPIHSNTGTHSTYAFLFLTGNQSVSNTQEIRMAWQSIKLNPPTSGKRGLDVYCQQWAGLACSIKLNPPMPAVGRSCMPTMNYACWKGRTAAPLSNTAYMHTAHNLVGEKTGKENGRREQTFK